MIRPEAKAQILRWREVIIGVAAVVIGLWWIGGAGPLFLIPALGFLLGGAALIWIGIQRARFRFRGQGPGSVQVDEGQITYYGPLTGGAIAVRELTYVTLDPNLHPTHWRLCEEGAAELLIPINAEGSEALFDAFATLPGFRMEQALAALKTAKEHPIVIWRRNLQVAAHSGLH